uniref:NADP-dependent oxidoreductase domain-containing protein n=1 Tax=Leersia perrieri TaxID=77586 RepID=A0A0D9W291_9ORYZ
MAATCDATAASVVPVPCVTLNSGHAMPVLGFGTGSSRTPADLPATIVHAIRLGYRHLDTASMYTTEGAVGAAVADAIRSGVVASRGDLFVTTKLSLFDADPARVVPALRESLSRLGLDYVDLFLIHWPVTMSKKAAADGDSESSEVSRVVAFDMEGVWRGMEECHRLGLAKSIGVSNFSAAKMSTLMALASVPPAVNQVEMNVGWRQEKVRQVCGQGGVVVAAYSPLGAYGAHWGSDAVMNSGVLHDVATRRGKTVAQVALRWLHEQGVCFVARSFNEERMKQNMEIFDWDLSEEDKKMIASIPQRRACQGEFFVSPDGPYKSLHDLWDGEI